MNSGCLGTGEKVIWRDTEGVFYRLGNGNLAIDGLVMNGFV